MATTNIVSIDGLVIAEETGGNRTDFIHDAVTSVAATTTAAGAVSNLYSYQPYGTRTRESGVGADPRFGFVGGFGYLMTAGEDDLYVRRRHYNPTVGLWNSVDVTWPSEPAYAYVDANPTSYVDPSGTSGECIVIKRMAMKRTGRFHLYNPQSQRGEWRPMKVICQDTGWPNSVQNPCDACYSAAPIWPPNCICSRNCGDYYMYEVESTQNVTKGWWTWKLRCFGEAEGGGCKGSAVLQALFQWGISLFPYGIGSGAYELITASQSCSTLNAKKEGNSPPVSLTVQDATGKVVSGIRIFEMQQTIYLAYEICDCDPTTTIPSAVQVSIAPKLTKRDCKNFSLP